jgi:predicted nucleic acid-binding protein
LTRVLVDTNILLRSAQPNHPLFSLTAGAVAKLLREKTAVFYCPQNIAEFWNVATRPVEVNGLGFSTSETIQEIGSIENLLTLLPDIPAIYPAWKQLVKDHRVLGVKVFDARLVAVMKVYAVDTVLTLNAADFKRYGAIKALAPAAVLA